jgi:hypothetical protein
VREQHPANQAANDIARRERDIHIESLDFGKPGVLEEDD